VPLKPARPQKTAMNRQVQAAPKKGVLAAVEAEDQLVALARRQSKVVAASADEAEVMRWIEDVRSVEGGE